MRETRAVWRQIISEQENSAREELVDLQRDGWSQLKSLSALSCYGWSLADLLPFLQSTSQTEFFQIDAIDNESVVKIPALRRVLQGIGDMHGGKRTE